MDELKTLEQELKEERPVAWEDFPDLNLYKDQVVVYLKRQLINIEGDGQLTPAMISNYVKDKLLPKAEGKKYTREHLAVLTEICLLKQVLSVRDIGFLLEAGAKNRHPEDFYTDFIKVLDDALKDTADKVDMNSEKEEIIDLALKFAIESYCAKLACEKLIALTRAQEPPPPSKKSK